MNRYSINAIPFSKQDAAKHHSAAEFNRRLADWIRRKNEIGNMPENTKTQRREKTLAFQQLSDSGEPGSKRAVEREIYGDAAVREMNRLQKEARRPNITSEQRAEISQINRKIDAENAMSMDEFTAFRENERQA